MIYVRRAFIVLLALSIALIVALWRMPASVALLIAPSAATKSAVHQIHSINGTIWRGSATLSTAFTPALQRLDWACDPVITSFAIECEVQGAVNTRATLLLASRRADIASLETSQYIDYSPNAAIKFRAESLGVALKPSSVSPTLISLNGGASAKSATFINGNERIDLGELFVDCAPSGSNTVCNVKNRASASTVDGSLTLTPNKASGSLEFKPSVGAAQRFSF